jgi:hypothetical protein
MQTEHILRFSPKWRVNFFITAAKFKRSFSLTICVRLASFIEPEGCAGAKPMAAVI